MVFLAFVSGLALCGAQKQSMDAAMLADGQKGVQFFQEGRYDEALAVFKKMEKKIPNNNEVTNFGQHL